MKKVALVVAVLTVASIAQAQLVKDLKMFDKDSMAWTIEKNLKKGVELYVDRDYVLTSLPKAYEGLEWIKTANDSADWFGDDPIATFVVTKNVTVFVAYDTRVDPPPILKGWEKTGDKIKNDADEYVEYAILKKDFDAGATVKMGMYEWDAGFYTIIIKERKDGQKKAK